MYRRACGNFGGNQFDIFWKSHLKASHAVGKSEDDLLQFFSTVLEACLDFLQTLLWVCTSFNRLVSLATLFGAIRSVVEPVDRSSTLSKHVLMMEDPFCSSAARVKTHLKGY